MKTVSIPSFQIVDPKGFSAGSEPVPDDTEPIEPLPPDDGPEEDAAADGADTGDDTP